jgi:hypothetical protein
MDARKTLESMDRMTDRERQRKLRQLTRIELLELFNALWNRTARGRR